MGNKANNSNHKRVGKHNHFSIGKTGYVPRTTDKPVILKYATKS